MLIKKTQGGLIMFEVYVDDILLTGSDDTSIHATKTYLHQHLNSKQETSPMEARRSFGTLRLNSLRTLTAITDCWAS